MPRGWRGSVSRWCTSRVCHLAWGVFELYLGLRPRPRFDPGMPAAYRIRDDAVGIRPAPGASWREALWLGEEPIYDVVYTIDAHGRRVTPASQGGDDALCVLFFGCSFSFGTGIGDEDTLPWLTSVATGRRTPRAQLLVRRLGPPSDARGARGRRGRGLARLRADACGLRERPRSRPSGGGPLALGPARAPLRAAQRRPPRARRKLRRSTLVSPLRALAREVGDPADPVRELRTDADRLRPLRGGRGGVPRPPRESLAGIDFRALLWDKGWKHDPEYWEGLQRRGLRVHFVSEILPDQREEALRYAISSHDGHPNRTANEWIAAWIAREILGEPTAAGVPETASAPSRAGGP